MKKTVGNRSSRSTECWGAGRLARLLDYRGSGYRAFIVRRIKAGRIKATRKGTGYCIGEDEVLRVIREEELPSGLTFVKQLRRDFSSRNDYLWRGFRSVGLGGKEFWHKPMIDDPARLGAFLLVNRPRDN